MVHYESSLRTSDGYTLSYALPLSFAQYSSPFIGLASDNLAAAAFLCESCAKQASSMLNGFSMAKVL